MKNITRAVPLEKLISSNASSSWPDIFKAHGSTRPAVATISIPDDTAPDTVVKR